jgi:hypothetical protein
MTYYDGFSHYLAENITHSPSRPAHSGPEICNEFPKSKLADKLAREVVLGGVSLVSRERPSFTSGSGLTKGLKFRLE